MSHLRTFHSQLILCIFFYNLSEISPKLMTSVVFAYACRTIRYLTTNRGPMDLGVYLMNVILQSRRKMQRNPGDYNPEDCSVWLHTVTSAA